MAKIKTKLRNEIMRKNLSKSWLRCTQNCGAPTGVGSGRGRDIPSPVGVGSGAPEKFFYFIFRNVEL